MWPRYSSQLDTIAPPIFRMKNSPTCLMLPHEPSKRYPCFILVFHSLCLYMSLSLGFLPLPKTHQFQVLWVFAWKDFSCSSSPTWATPLHKARARRTTLEKDGRFVQIFRRVRVVSTFTLPETNSSPLKMDGWETSFLLGWPIFRCYVSFREGIFLGGWRL